jgi:hypothetical protein|tara:strand:+ start:12965 stop:13297 length:333 start_codon:yes stop_codon:yes gene_type:complete
MNRIILTLYSTLCFSTLAIQATEHEYMVEEFNSLEGLTKDTGFCELQGKHYAYNTKIAMNREMLKIYQTISHKVPDASIVVVMQCKYIVDPFTHDHPEQVKRQYIWVAGQ